MTNDDDDDFSHVQVTERPRSKGVAHYLMTFDICRTMAFRSSSFRSPIAAAAALVLAVLLLLSSCHVRAFQLQTSRVLSRPPPAAVVRSSLPHVASVPVSFPTSSQPINVRISRRPVRGGSPGALFSSSSHTDESDRPRNKRPDGLIESTAYALRRTSWFSWWSQVILTTISAVILLFARSVGLATTGSPAAGVKSQASASFFIGGVGIAIRYV